MLNNAKYYKMNTVKTAVVDIMTSVDAEYVSEYENSDVNVCQ